MGFGDFVPDVVENAVEDGVELVGEGIEEGGDWTADRMEEAGWDGAADTVRSGTRSVANRMGADVAELQLGQTDDPKKLIYGSAGKLRSTAGHLTDFQGAFNKVGHGLQGLDSSHLKGEAADAFREKVAVEPKKWFTAADACEKASKALSDFAGTVEWAQGKAQEAIDKYNKAEKATEDAEAKYESDRTAYNDAVEKYNDAPSDERDPDSLPPNPGKFSDPGTAGRAAAQEILDEARTQRNEAHRTAEAAVSEARDAAPAKPSYSEQVQDGLVGMQLDASHFYGGIVKGSAGIVSFARSVNPTDPYNITHPAEYLTSLNSTTAGLVTMVNDPAGTAQNMWNTFKKDPSEGLGRLVPELIGTRGLGSIKKLATTARHAAPDGPPSRSHLDGDGTTRHDTPDNCRSCDGTDPIDLATGRMFLPQRDVSLPGALPLVFSRRVESGYRAGRWFGPSWSSTVDQRLEVDAEGVVFVSEDGLLLAYPHPAPDVPTLASAGPRWPLEGTEDGGFTLSDPESGVVRHFGPPEDGVDGVALIEQISDRNGHRIVFEYAEDGTPLGLVHSGGYHLRLVVEGERITALRLAGSASDGSDDQVLVRYGYTDGNLTEVIGSSGRPLRFEYDDEQRVIAWVDSNDRRYDYVYDTQDRCIAEGSPEGHLQVRIDYEGSDEATGHKVTTVTTAAGHASRYVINDAHQVVAQRDPLGNTVRTQPDRYGRVLSSTDALGRTTGFHRDESGRLTSITRPDRHETTISYQDLGLPSTVKGPDGATWRQEYDEQGNRTSSTDPAGHTTRYAYDASGRLVAVTNALGETTRVRCDAAGLPVEITDPLGAVTRYTRDSMGRPVALTDPLGAVTRLEWSVEGQLARRIDPDGAEQSWAYDGEGNRVRHMDANGGLTTYEYTHFDLLAAQTGPDGVRYEFVHDTQLRLTQVRNPQGLTWDYTYDPAGRLVAECDFDDRTVTYTHNAAGQLTSRTNPLGQSIDFDRDTLGHIIRKDAAGQVTDYTYDPAGRLVSATGPDAEILYHRDKLGRIKSELVNGHALNHTYDPLGRRTRRVTPTGAVSTFAYDASGNRTALTASGHTLDFTHDQAGRETARRIGDHLTLAQAWDPAGRLTEQTVVGGASTTPVQRRAYTYRQDGYLTGLTDQLGGTRSFDLDAAGRVTAVHAAGWSETYAYDEAGNQTHAHWPTNHASTAATGPRTYTGTRLHTAGRLRYTHDDAGRLTQRQKTRLSKKPDTWRYTWDAEDRLTECTTPDGTLWRYRYDPLGRRTTKQRLTGTGDVAEQVDFTWDGPTLIEQTTTTPDIPHPVTLTWNHDGLTPLTQTERLTDETTQAEIDSRFFAIITDLVGTPTELLDETGDIAWHTRTTLWGTTTWNRNATTYTPLRFPGQYFDPETGLHYNYFRHYDPDTARYTTPDPLGLTPAPNPTTYPHNPHTATDPLGLTPQGCGIDLSNATPHSGRFPRTADPNEILVRRKEDGSVTAYAVYDSDGLTVKRVDVDPDSKPHAGIPAPHVLETHKNVNPKTGEEFITWDKMPRPARPDELPR